MKKSILFFLAAFLTISGATFGKSKENIEVLYFKAKQCACKTMTCNAIEDQVKSLIDKEFQGENIEFKRVWLNEKENDALIQKYSAKPQTVVLVKKKKDKETITDLTQMVNDFAVKQNKEKFETELKEKIIASLK
ncbi:MAG TPA: hypothetical protein DHV48_06715 [Prolixibacteraceae bacterium]|nr:hypothetical protein [Prolixibacteraceae bacterium]